MTHLQLLRISRPLVALAALLACTPTTASEPSPGAARATPAREAGWFMSGGGRNAYGVQPDADVVRDGRPTLRLEPIPEPPKYGTWMRNVEAAPYRGKRIRLSALTRTEGATGRADFWARIQAADSPGDGAGLGGRWIPLPPDAGWQRQEVVLDVPAEGEWIQYGVGLAGPGNLWIDEPRLEVVPPEPSATSAAPQASPAGP